MKPLRETLTQARLLARQVRRLSGVWIGRHLHRQPGCLPVLVLMITDKCNLRCPMCGARDDGRSSNEHLTLEEWKAVIRSAARLRTTLISITGGEALLRKDVFDIIRYARTRDIAVHLNTNGTLLNDRVVDRLRHSGVDTISISLDGHAPHIHESIRGEGTFEKTIEGIRNLRRRAPAIRIGINYVFNTRNFRGMHEMVQLAADLGVEQLKFAPIHTNLQHKNKPLAEYGDMLFREEDLDDLQAELDTLQNTLRGTGIQTTSNYFFKGATRLYRSRPPHFYCYAGYASCVVDWRGGVAACFDKARVLNVRDRPLEEIWRSREFREHRQLVHHCESNCWESTNAELSHRFSPRAMLCELRQNWRDLMFYFGSRPSAPVETLTPTPEDVPMRIEKPAIAAMTQASK